MSNQDFSFDGREFNFRCPFCGDSKRDYRKKRGWYNINKDQFHCFNCQKSVSSNAFEAIIEKIRPGQDKIKFVLEALGGNIENVLSNNIKVEDKKSAISNWNEFLEYECVIVNEALENTPSYEYLKSRRLNNVNYPFYLCHNKDSRFFNRLIIPFFNEVGDCVYFQARKLNDNDPLELKYMNPVGSRDILFGIDRIDRKKTVVLLEGPIDSLFVENGLALMTCAITQNQLKMLNNLNIILMLDNDEAGKAASLKLSQKHNFRVFMYPKDFNGCKDINEYIISKNIDKLSLDFVEKNSVSATQYLLYDKIKFI